MCDPITLGAAAGIATGAASSAGLLSGLGIAATGMGAVGLGATVASGVMSAAAAYQQGQVAAQVGKANQQIAEDAARRERQRGEEEAQAIRRKASQLTGTQRNIMAARGLDLESGTALDLTEQSNFFGEWDAAMARQNAEYRANTYRNQGRMARFEGQMEARNANARAAGSLLAATTTVADKWYSAPAPKYKSNTPRAGIY